MKDLFLFGVLAVSVLLVVASFTWLRKMILNEQFYYPEYGFLALASVCIISVGGCMLWFSLGLGGK